MAKLDFESIGQWFSDNKTLVVVLGLGVLLTFGIILFASDRISNWWSGHSINNDKAKAKELTNSIANKTAQIEEMKQQRAEEIGELKVLTNNLVNANVADEQARENVNASANDVQKAVANLDHVINSNSNVNATLEDVNQKLDKLGIK